MRISWRMGGIGAVGLRPNVVDRIEKHDIVVNLVDVFF